MIGDRRQGTGNRNYGITYSPLTTDHSLRASQGGEGFPLTMKLGIGYNVFQIAAAIAEISVEFEFAIARTKSQRPIILKL